MALAAASSISGCGARSSTPANTTPRATVRAFNLDLQHHDWTAACKLVRPSARPLLTDERNGQSLARCVSGLSSAHGQRLIVQYKLSAAKIAAGSVTKIGPTLDSFAPAKIPIPTYLLNHVGGGWLIANL